MPVTVGVNSLSVVHMASGGVTIAFPDVCKTPAVPSPVPIPYPNVALSVDTAMGSKQVKCDGNPICLNDSFFKMSTGDEAGSVGGVASGMVKGKAEFILYSFDVKVEGKSVPRLADLMVQNKGGSPNTPPFPLVQPPAVVVVLPDPDEDASEDDVEIATLEEGPPED